MLKCPAIERGLFLNSVSEPLQIVVAHITSLTAALHKAVFYVRLCDEYSIRVYHFFKSHAKLDKLFFVDSYYYYS